MSRRRRSNWPKTRFSLYLQKGDTLVSDGIWGRSTMPFGQGMGWTRSWSGRGCSSCSNDGSCAGWARRRSLWEVLERLSGEEN
jgi:hypothetical protein